MVKLTANVLFHICHYVQPSYIFEQLDLLKLDMNLGRVSE